MQIAPGPGNNSSTVVNGGGAVLHGGTVVVSAAPGHYAPTQYVIVATTGGVSGTFAGVTGANFAGSLTLDYTTIPGDVLLDLAGAFLFTAPGASTNQQNVLNGLNNALILAPLPPQFQNLANLSGPALLNALSQLSGEAATGAEKGVFQFMTQFLGLMLDPFVDGRDGFGGAFGFAPEQTQGLPPDVALAYASVLKAPPPATFDQRWNIWGSAFGGYNKTSGDAVVGSHDTTVRDYGFAAGMDYRVTRDSVVGFALAGGGTSWSLAQGMGGGSSDTFAAGLYGKTRFGPAYLAASLGYANHWMSTTRTALADQLTAKFDGQSFGARFEAGCRYGLFDHATIGLTPYAAVQGQAFRTPSYSETDVTGGGFGLAYTAMSAHDIRAELGARFDQRTAFYGMPLILRARAAWAHDWVSNPALGAVFQGLPGAGFIVNGAAPPHDSALASAGAELRVRPDWSFSARFDGEFASGAQTYSGIGTVRYAW